MKYECEELEAVAARKRGVIPSAHGCEDCLKAGSEWVHLRLCLSCGHVGCCDNSPNRHATAHFKATSHPVIRSFEPDELWAYCYPDEAFAPKIPMFDAELAPVHYSPPVTGESTQP